MLEDRLAPAVWTVTTTADSGANSLRDILTNQPNLANGDTINFTLARGATITLTSGSIPINKDLTIDGGQGSNISISGNNASDIFVFDNAGKVLSDTVKNLIFVNANAGNGIGGAIYERGSLTLVNDQFNNNVAGSGAAVYVVPASQGDSLTVTSCRFTSNQATTGNGAAIAAVGVSVTLNSDGFTSDTSLKNGGAVYADNGGSQGITLTVNAGTQFTSNQVTGSGDRNNYYGGAIYTTDSLTVTGSANANTAFNSNSATDGGGAIMFEPPDGNTTFTASITGVTFQNNTGETGGAFFSYLSDTQATVNVSVTGCLFQNNQATGPAGDIADMRGGALAIIHSASGSATATATITNDTFYQNYSENQGGAIWLYTPQTGTGTTVTTLTSLTVYQNQAASQGGGLYISDPGSGGSKPDVRNSIIAGNLIENPAADGPDVYGKVNSLGFNLIGQAGTAAGNDGWVGSDFKGSVSSPLDPGLNSNGPPDNGGPTKTIKLVTGSPAYRAGDPTLANAGQPFNQDQRGLTRSQQFVSVGAYDPDAS